MTNLPFSYCFPQPKDHWAMAFLHDTLTYGDKANKTGRIAPMMTDSKSLATILGSLLLSISVVAPVLGQTVLVPTGSTWKYLDDGSDQGTLWRGTGFDDGGWDTGPAQLGYGDGDESTVVSYGPDSNDKYITTYFRHTFSVSDPSQFEYLELRLLRDDGAVVYLNGVEVKKSNMPDSTVHYLLRARSAVGGDAEDAFYEDYLSGSYLSPGPNVLAVEIHQISGTSSDISFDMELLGLAEIQHPTRKAPYLLYTGDNTEMRVLWQLIVPDTCYIVWGSDTEYSSGGATTYEFGGDHQHSYTIENLIPSTRYFYRVVAEADTFAGAFWTAPYSNTGEARFFAYGDTRTYPSDHDQVAGALIGAYAANPSPHSLIISVGDLISNGNLEDDWDSQFFNSTHSNIRSMLANFPYQACMGNHEGSGVLFTKYFPYPFVADRFWSFDYGPAHFVVMDQYVDYSSGSAQHNWIENDLASTKKPWKFIFLHEPGWSAGGGHGNDATVQTDIQPLCEQYGVSIVFGGHNHYYARAEVNGVQHVTTGGGGAPLHVPNLGYPNVVTGASAYHYCDIEVGDGTLSFAAVSISGDTLDAFTVEGTVTAVEQQPKGPTVREFALYDARPNPFNPTTVIRYDVPAGGGAVSLRVYDVRGRHIRTLVHGNMTSGQKSATWNAKDTRGNPVSSGIYFYLLRAGGTTLTKKMILLK